MKAMLVILIALCSTQAFAVPVDNQDWQDTFNAVINKLNDALTKAKAFIDDNAKKVEDVIADVIKDGYNIVDQKILEVTQAATEQGIDIGPCIDQQKQLVNNDIDQLVQGAIGCITGEVDQAIGDLQSVVKAISDTEQALVQASDSISACDGNFLDKAACIAEATAKAVASAAKSDEEAVKAIADIAVIYNTFPTQIENCEKKQLETAEADALQFVVNVGLCLI